MNGANSSRSGRATHDTLRSNSWSGGASRDRTDDLRVANATLSQLSYGPFREPIGSSWSRRGPTRLIWWVWEELNLRPHPYQGCALTN